MLTNSLPMKTTHKNDRKDTWGQTEPHMLHHVCHWQQRQTSWCSQVTEEDIITFLIKPTKWLTKGEWGRVNLRLRDINEEKNGMRMSVTLSLQCCLRRNHVASHAQHIPHKGSIRSACHQQASSYCSLMYQSCCETEGGKDSQRRFLHTHFHISVWLPVHPSTKYLFRLSFHPPFSSPFDTNLLIMPLISHHGSPSLHSLTPFLGLSSHPSPSRLCST